MRYKLKAPFTGTLFLLPRGTKLLTADRDGLEFQLVAGSGGQITEASVSCVVPQEKLERFRSAIAPGTGGVQQHVTIGGDATLREQLLGELRSLESGLAFSFHGGVVRGLNWRRLEDEFIPETERDRELLAVTSFSTTLTWPVLKIGIRAEWFSESVKYAPRYESLRSLKAFWRRGMNDLQDLQFADAFYNFYFVIEDCFSGGKTSEKAVLSQFNKSDEYRRVAESSLAAFAKQNDQHLETLKSMMTLEACAWSPSGLQRFLFKIRGVLHHYSSQSRRTRINPFTQEEHHTVAILAMHVATMTILLRMGDINQQYQEPAK